MSGPTQERIADGLTGTAITTGAGMTIADFNAYLEAGTLIVGLIAGIFALFFHIRRYRNERKKK
jgi:hypothetical protein